MTMICDGKLSDLFSRCFAIILCFSHSRSSLHYLPDDANHDPGHFLQGTPFFPCLKRLCTTNADKDRKTPRPGLNKATRLCSAFLKKSKIIGLFGCSW